MRYHEVVAQARRCKWKLRKYVSRGRFGYVFQLSNKTRALKVIPRPNNGQAEYLTMKQLRERLAPMIVPVYELQTTRRATLYVMEYYPHTAFELPPEAAHLVANFIVEFTKALADQFGLFFLDLHRNNILWDGKVTFVACDLEVYYTGHETKNACMILSLYLAVHRFRHLPLAAEILLANLQEWLDAEQTNLTSFISRYPPDHLIHVYEEFMEIDIDFIERMLSNKKIGYNLRQRRKKAVSISAKA